MSPVAPLPGLPGAQAAAVSAMAMTAARGARIRRRRFPRGREMDAAGEPVTAIGGWGGVSVDMRERVADRILLEIRPASTAGQLRGTAPNAQGRRLPLRQVFVDNSLPVIAAL